MQEKRQIINSDLTDVMPWPHLKHLLDLSGSLHCHKYAFTKVWVFSFFLKSSDIVLHGKYWISISSVWFFALLKWNHCLRESGYLVSQMLTIVRDTLGHSINFFYSIIRLSSGSSSLQCFEYWNSNHDWSKSIIKRL